jgi:hypothetical protein
MAGETPSRRLQGGGEGRCQRWGESPVEGQVTASRRRHRIREKTAALLKEPKAGRRI